MVVSSALEEQHYSLAWFVGNACIEQVGFWDEASLSSMPSNGTAAAMAYLATTRGTSAVAVREIQKGKWREPLSRWLGREVERSIGLGPCGMHGLELILVLGDEARYFVARVRSSLEKKMRTTWYYAEHNPYPERHWRSVRVAVAALGLSADHVAVPVLTRALESHDWVVAVEAAASLANLGDKASAAAPVLEEVAREHWHPRVRRAAQGALRTLRTATEFHRSMRLKRSRWNLDSESCDEYVKRAATPLSRALESLRTPSEKVCRGNRSMFVRLKNTSSSAHWLPPDVPDFTEGFGGPPRFSVRREGVGVGLPDGWMVAFLGRTDDQVGGILQRRPNRDPPSAGIVIHVGAIATT